MRVPPTQRLAAWLAAILLAVGALGCDNAQDEYDTPTDEDPREKAESPELAEATADPETVEGVPGGRPDEAISERKPARSGESLRPLGRAESDEADLTGAEKGLDRPVGQPGVVADEPVAGEVVRPEQLAAIETEIERLEAMADGEQETTGELTEPTGEPALTFEQRALQTLTQVNQVIDRYQAQIEGWEPTPKVPIPLREQLADLDRRVDEIETTLDRVDLDRYGGDDARRVRGGIARELANVKKGLTEVQARLNEVMGEQRRQGSGS